MLPYIFCTLILWVISFYPLFPLNSSTLSDKDLPALVCSLTDIILPKIYYPLLHNTSFTGGLLLVSCLMFMLQVYYTKQNIWRKDLHMREHKVFIFLGSSYPIQYNFFSSSTHSSLNFIISFSLQLSNVSLCTCATFNHSSVYRQMLTPFPGYCE